MSTPTEIKAQAIALHAMGYSCRRIERQLRSQFPGADIPNYATINRWGRSRPTKRFAQLRWYDVAHRAAEIMMERMDELETVPFMQLVKAYSRINDIVFNTQETYLRR